MRYSTYKRFVRELDNTVPVTTLHLDCSHDIVYFGTPDQAEQIVRDNGGAIAGTLSRCRECYRRWQALVANDIHQARGTHQ